MRLELSQHRRIPVIQVHGRMIGAPNHYERFEETLERALADGSPQLVIDLSDCRYVQSSGVGMIMAARSSMEHRHGTLRVVVNTKPIRRLFDLLHLEEIVDVYESLDQAIDPSGKLTKH